MTLPLDRDLTEDELLRRVGEIAADREPWQGLVRADPGRRT